MAGGWTIKTLFKFEHGIRPLNRAIQLRQAFRYGARPTHCAVQACNHQFVKGDPILIRKAEALESFQFVCSSCYNFFQRQGREKTAEEQAQLDLLRERKALAKDQTVCSIPDCGTKVNFKYAVGQRYFPDNRKACDGCFGHWYKVNLHKPVSLSFEECIIERANYYRRRGPAPTIKRRPKTRRGSIPPEDGVCEGGESKSCTQIEPGHGGRWKRADRVGDGKVRCNACYSLVSARRRAANSLARNKGAK